MNRYAAAVLLLIALSIVAAVSSGVIVGDVLRLPSYVSNFFRPAADDYVGKRWAVLITGSNGYSNYGHQVKERASNDNGYYDSHVKQYGVSQRDADLLYFWEEYRTAPEGSARKIEFQKQLVEALSHRMHVDNSIKLVGKLLFGIEKGSEVLKIVRPTGQPRVDDLQCLKTLIRTFETHCGSLSYYGMKHTQSIANFCNAGIREEQMSEASAQACVTFPSNPWSSVHKGFSA